MTRSLPLPVMAGGAEDDEPDVVVVAPPAEAPESVSADDFHSESITDESVTVIVETPAAEPAPEPEAHTHEELLHCEHCQEHAARIAQLEEALAAAPSAAAEPEPEPEPEPPATPASETEVERAPKRECWLYKKPFKRGEE